MWEHHLFGLSHPSPFIILLFYSNLLGYAMWYYVEESRREKLKGILDINDLYEFSLNILEPVLTGMFTKDECEHEVDSNLTCKLCNKKQIAVFGENEDFVRHIFIEKWE